MNSRQFQGLVLGVPKEIMAGENRVSAIPATVEKMIHLGATVLVQSGAGHGCFHSDEEYEKAGAKILSSPIDVYKKAQVILKVKEPLYNEELRLHEVDMMHENQILISFLHPAAPHNHKLVKSLMESGITSITLDSIPRIPRARTMDALASMSMVGGYKSVIMAVDRLAKFAPMVDTNVGFIEPSTVFVVGTGVAGLQAVKTAKNLGALVFAADIRPEAARNAQDFGAEIVEMPVPRDVAVDKEGCVNRLDEHWLIETRNAIKDTVKLSDIIILTSLIPGRTAPLLITDEMVQSMKPGSVIVDVAADQGGNCALTAAGKVVRRYGVSIDGTTNIPGMIPVSSTWLFANNLYNLLSAFVKNGELDLDTEDEILQSALVTKNGKLLHKGTLEAMGVKR